MADVEFGNDDIATITEIAMEARDDLVDKLREAFPGRSAEALTFVLGTLLASGFIDDREVQHDMAQAANQVLARWPHPILWRMTPASA